MNQQITDWVVAQRRQIRGMSDATLAKELAFAEGFGPPESMLEGTWLDELRLETQRREVAAQRER